MNRIAVNVIRLYMVVARMMLHCRGFHREPSLDLKLALDRALADFFLHISKQTNKTKPESRWKEREGSCFVIARGQKCSCTNSQRCVLQAWVPPFFSRGP